MAETARKARLSVPSPSLPRLVDRFPRDRPAPTACDAGDQGDYHSIQRGGNPPHFKITGRYERPLLARTYAA